MKFIKRRKIENFCKRDHLRKDTLKKKIKIYIYNMFDVKFKKSLFEEGKTRIKSEY